jgi:hypothetical protein
MARVCVRHPFEHSETLCSHCGLEFCRDCLVTPGGSRKRALCVQCALAASGVRSTAANHPALSKRELKKRLKEREDEEKALARLQRQAEPIPPIANPFTPGWAIVDEAPEPAPSLPPPPPPPTPTPMYEPEPAVEPPAADAPPRQPTLADLLPSMMSRGEEDHAAALARLPTREQELGWDESGDPEEPDRSRRGINLLRRREAEPDTSQESSEMMAWLDQVFAPKDQ